ncbi:hypothetical protein BKA63DRAFT_558948 [Paraphoma chrysanthemicola]|nr:hypothetical protein BKA63DRAFT_558948 [Paraphoma chrysanthemicola]
MHVSPHSPIPPRSSSTPRAATACDVCGVAGKAATLFLVWCTCIVRESGEPEESAHHAMYFGDRLMTVARGNGQAGGRFVEREARKRLQSRLAELRVMYVLTRKILARATNKLATVFRGSGTACGLHVWLVAPMERLRHCYVSKSGVDWGKRWHMSGGVKQRTKNWAVGSAQWHDRMLQTHKHVVGLGRDGSLGPSCGEPRRGKRTVGEVEMLTVYRAHDAARNGRSRDCWPPLDDTMAVPRRETQGSVVATAVFCPVSKMEVKQRAMDDRERDYLQGSACEYKPIALHSFACVSLPRTFVVFSMQLGFKTRCIWKLPPTVPQGEYMSACRRSVTRQKDVVIFPGTMSFKIIHFARVGPRQERAQLASPETNDVKKIDRLPSLPPTVPSESGRNDPSSFPGSNDFKSDRQSLVPAMVNSEQNPRLQTQTRSSGPGSGNTSCLGSGSRVLVPYRSDSIALR